MSTEGPKCIMVLSGKRKSGKDFIADKLAERYTKEVCSILRLSGPLKKQYAQGAFSFPSMKKVAAKGNEMWDLVFYQKLVSSVYDSSSYKEHGLNYEELLKESTYKESYRADMIKWGEEKRNKEPYFFCKKTVEEADRRRPLWIISDARRLTDIQFFRENFSKITNFIRVQADESVRKARGYIFTEGIDDAESECGLDTGIEWDHVIVNNGSNTEEFNFTMENICSYTDKQLDQNLLKS